MDSKRVDLLLTKLTVLGKYLKGQKTRILKHTAFSLTLRLLMITLIDRNCSRQMLELGIFETVGKSDKDDFEESKI